MNSIISRRIHIFFEDGQRFEGFVDHFIDLFHIEELLQECGATKQRGIPSIEIFRYLLLLTFYGVSHYRDSKECITGNPIKPSTVYRFLNNPKVDWIKFTTLLSSRIFEFLSPKYKEDGKQAYFIVDDTAYKRPYSQFTEDISSQKDHINNSFYLGYRLNMLSICYPPLILPISGVYLSSSDESNLIFKGETKKKEDGFSYILQQLSRGTAKQALLYQIDQAREAGFRTKAVLFDTWYTFPGTIKKLSQKGEDVVGALKNSKTLFEFRGKLMRVGAIFDLLLKESPLPDKDGIFFAPLVVAHASSIPLRLVYAENVNPSRQYFCIACNDLSLSPKTVISVYRLRWSIETIFKDLKNPSLNLTSGNQSLSLRGISAYTAIVQTRYMMLITERAMDDKEKERSVQDQFHICRSEQLAVDSVNDFLEILKEAIPDMAEKLHTSKEDVERALIEGLESSDTFKKLYGKMPKFNFDNVDEKKE